MGSNMATELADGILGIDMESAITMHLRGNHYPPVPYSMVPVCIEAIEAANDGDWNREIELPEGVSWRGENYSPAYALIEGHHLDAWIDGDEDYE